MHDHILIDTRQIDALLAARGWTRTRLHERSGIDETALRQAEADGRAAWPLARALADALDVAPSVLEAGSDPAKRWHQRRRNWTVLGLLALFLMTLAFGYRVGADLAARDNRADCIAAGGTDCGAAAGVSTRSR